MDRVQVGILLRQYHANLSMALYNLSDALPEELREEIANPIIPGISLSLGYSCLRELQALADRLEEDINTLLGGEARSTIGYGEDYLKRFVND